MTNKVKEVLLILALGIFLSVSFLGFYAFFGSIVYVQSHPIHQVTK